MAIKAFTDTPVTYEQFLGWVLAHKQADEYRQGLYWSDDKSQGCAVGCVLHDAYRSPDVQAVLTVAGEEIGDPEYSEHRLFEPLFGIPSQLAQLQDAIFEGLPDDLSAEFPLQFAQALKAGADYSLVWNRFAVWMLVDSINGVIRFADNDTERKAISNVAALHQRIITGESPAESEWAAARAAARAAASAAAMAAASAAAMAAARAAAWAAARDAAWDAARAAARAAAWDAAWAAARDAAWDAARAAAFIAMRDKLLSLLAEAEPVADSNSNPVDTMPILAPVDGQGATQEGIQLSSTVKPTNVAKTPVISKKERRRQKQAEIRQQYAASKPRPAKPIIDITEVLRSLGIGRAA